MVSKGKKYVTDRIVPSNNFQIVRLHGQNLTEAVFEVFLSYEELVCLCTNRSMPSYHDGTSSGRMRCA